MSVLKGVFGFVMYGVGDPWNPTTEINPVLYTDAALPSTGLPAELTNATIYPSAIAKRPGINWGADPRNPAGSDSTATITLLDDELGTLGTLFLEDVDQNFWLVEDDRLADDATTITLVGVTATTAPANNAPYYLGNECVTLVLNDDPTRGGTATYTVARAKCGSQARVHVVRPSEYSAGEDGSADRLLLKQKPDWSEKFYCGCYLFLLDELGAISSYILRRGIVAEAPRDIERPYYEIKVKFLEDALCEHTIGAVSKVVSPQRLIATQIAGSRVDNLTPKTVSILLSQKSAEEFFNEPLGERGGALLSNAMVTNLNTRLFADSSVTYQIKIDDGDQWIFRITKIKIFQYQNEPRGSLFYGVNISASLVAGGRSPGATIGASTQATTTSPQPALPGIPLGSHTVGSHASEASVLILKPWWSSSVQGYRSGAADGDKPQLSLRLVMRKSVVNAFLTMACSRDGTSGGTYDKIIGGVGAGLPQAYLNVGAVFGAGGPSVLVPGNTGAMAQLNQLLNPINTYYFDLSQGISLRDFLTNEFIASQLLLGPLQNGLLTLKSWVHEVSPTVTLNPIQTRTAKVSTLTALKRLDLAAGTKVTTLEPLETRSVRWFGATRIKSSETQAVRFWREGVNLSVAEITQGDLSQLVRAFYYLFGGTPRVYRQAIAIQDYVTDAIEFGDSVTWSDSTVVTPQGLGISGTFFVIGIDIDFDRGEVNLLLLLNTTTPAALDLNAGRIAPSLRMDRINMLSPTVAEIDVTPIGGAADWNPSTDYGTVFEETMNNGGWIKIDNFDQAPVGTTERAGSVESLANIASIVSTGVKTTITVILNASCLRGDFADITALATANESLIKLSERRPATSNLTGQLIEADTSAQPNVGNFNSFQGRAPINRRFHTFKRAP